MPLIEEYGYDTKQACHAIRNLIFLERFYKTRSIEQALWLEENSEDKIMLAEIKAGWYTERVILEIARQKVEQNKKMEQWYTAQPTRPDLKEELENTIKQLVRERL